jgi:hypothetical protein
MSARADENELRVDGNGRRERLVLAVFVSLCSLPGCAGRCPLDAQIGKPIAAAIAVLGTPEDTSTLEGGYKSYTWTRTKIKTETIGGGFECVEVRDGEQICRSTAPSETLVVEDPKQFSIISDRKGTAVAWTGKCP